MDVVSVTNWLSIPFFVSLTIGGLLVLVLGFIPIKNKEELRGIRKVATIILGVAFFLGGAFGGGIMYILLTRNFPSMSVWIIIILISLAFSIYQGIKIYRVQGANLEVSELRKKLKEKKLEHQ